jgi:hypothetical protein
VNTHRSIFLIEGTKPKQFFGWQIVFAFESATMVQSMDNGPDDELITLHHSIIFIIAPRGMG